MAYQLPIIVIASAGLVQVTKPTDGEIAGEFDGWYWPLRTLEISGVIYHPEVSDGYSATKTATHREHHGVDICYRRKAGGGPDQQYARNTHEGTPNYFLPTGREAICPRDGKIFSCGSSPRGDWAVIDCGKPIAIFMQHMRSLRIAKGSTVRAGDVIGTASYDPTNTGMGFNHVHLEVWRNGPSSAHVDPLPYLKRAGYL